MPITELLAATGRCYCYYLRLPFVSHRNPMVTWQPWQRILTQSQNSMSLGPCIHYKGALLFRRNVCLSLYWFFLRFHVNEMKIFVPYYGITRRLQ